MPDALLCLQTFSKLKMLLKMFQYFQKAERREVLLAQRTGFLLKKRFAVSAMKSVKRCMVAFLENKYLHILIPIVSATLT
ncbi:hypothetical protein C2541_21775 [Salmonella enterica]|uniref:Uncharacterized protein n=1 Tax=Salmonella enterica TaxID=28901 RepID=A0A3J5XQT6_SALER|nr:hypothetical protein [Salmonella enterica]ECD9818647.1 hypothetical protein [Salmonella enterica]ECR9154709.1 hypothetical protein [Salmonella enterica]MFO65400.1 hypothetical protein [Salmonella enterica]MHI24940.1 hypothetical protein [Salmonella enterica]